MASDLWTLQNPVFAFYSFCASVLLFKTLIMSIYTGRTRHKYKSFSWPEDNVMHGIKEEVKPPHPAVERIRSCHRNDLENIVPFCIIGLLYTLTNPSLLTARLLFGAYTVARLFHTVVFVKLHLQPYRFFSFLFSYFITFVLLISFFIHVLSYI
ncbi:microsomal glutathione S-transferase 1-like [Dendronephthya gigantea]|uniref:microsomal glutathione S-transferase 1-like n=1 Tax=Dendronephthya gigantea TaxID=151771 RepID=UPI00106C1CCF|nr:microsomal glutathione S-transferase 1-like [Dendronephthya gigantea]